MHRKRVVHDATKATNRALRGGDVSARAKARWPSEQATTDLDRLVIQLDGWRVEIDRGLREG